jgi:hypothetical protein
VRGGGGGIKSLKAGAADGEAARGRGLGLEHITWISENYPDLLAGLTYISFIDSYI